MLEFIQNADTEILLFIQEHIRNDFLTPIFNSITKVGEFGLIWIALSIVLLAFKNTRKAGTMALIALGLSFILNNLILKNLVARVRPYEVIDGLTLLCRKPTDFSFPSGHTACAFSAGIAIFCLIKKRAGILILIFAVLMGFSRLYLGAHYPSDVLAGALSGGIIGFISAKYISGFIFRKKDEEINKSIITSEKG